MRTGGHLGTIVAVFRICLKSKYKPGTTDLLRSTTVLLSRKPLQLSKRARNKMCASFVSLASVRGIFHSYKHMASYARDVCINTLRPSCNVPVIAGQAITKLECGSAFS